MTAKSRQRSLARKISFGSIDTVALTVESAEQASGKFCSLAQDSYRFNTNLLQNA